jgi:hypothetical protein
MTKYALVFENICRDVSETTTPTAEGCEWVEVPSGQDVVVGWKYINGQFIAPTPLAPIVFTTIRKLEILERCETAGILDAVIQTLDDPNNKVLKYKWDASVTINKDDQTVRAFIAQCGGDPDIILA